MALAFEKRKGFIGRSAGKKTEGRALKLLLNGTWVFLPTMQQSQFTDNGLWWRKVQRLLQAPSKENRAARAQKAQTPWEGKGF